MHKEELFPLSHFATNRVKLISEAFSVLRGQRLESAIPPTLRGIDYTELKSLCLEELKKIDTLRIVDIIEGRITSKNETNSSPNKQVNLLDRRKRHNESGPSIPMSELKKKIKKVINEESSSFESDQEQIQNKIVNHDVVKKKSKEKKKKHSSSHKCASPATLPTKVKKVKIGQKVKTKKIKKLKKLKKAEKVKKKTNQEISVAEQEKKPAIPGQRTLMELLELEYRAKAIKALLKFQGFNATKIDDVFKDEKVVQPEEKVVQPEVKEKKVIQLQVKEKKVIQRQVKEKKVAQPEIKEKKIVQVEHKEEKIDQLEDEEEVVVQLEDEEEQQINQLEEEEEEEKINQLEEEEGQIVQLEDEEENMNEVEEEEEKTQQIEDEEKNVSQVEDEEEEKIVQPEEENNADQVQDEEEKTEQIEDEEANDDEKDNEFSKTSVSPFHTNIHEELDYGDGRDGDGEELTEYPDEATPITWYERWYSSKKVQKVMNSNKMYGKVRHKLKQANKKEKQEAEELSKESQKSTKSAVDDQDDNNVPLIGSIQEYEKLFGKKIITPSPAVETTVNRDSDNKSPLKLAESDEDDDNELWGDILGNS